MKDRQTLSPRADIKQASLRDSNDSNQDCKRICAHFDVEMRDTSVYSIRILPSQICSAQTTLKA
ncbi:hypothetical protein CBOM_03472 [Ceraceosorus bombacis]|uniref:Uncharacterized protein n=1 Tax=Ceraceosorus bombacis TaxID=401625 RepID=A0A0P1BLH1_9BASI|nr:hypothetical protein CBOM_03472 [Ceraceosorus bombacis]